MKKRTLTYYLLSFIVGSATIVSCGNDRDRLSREKMVEVLHDIQLAEAIYQTQYKDFSSKEQKDALIEGILQKHGITQAQLDSSLVWYADNAEIYMRVNDSIISSLTAELKVLEKKHPHREDLGVNILPAYYYLSGDIPTLAFDIDSTQVKKYPQFSLEFNTMGIRPQMKAELEVRFEYADTTIVRNQPLNKDDHFKMTGDTLALKNISGYFHIDPHQAVNNKVLVYDILLKNLEIAKDSTAMRSDTIK